MTKVNFHGRLGKVFGKEWNLDICSVGEGIHAINIFTNRKLYPWLLEQDKKGIRYKVLINKKPFKTDVDLNKINNVFDTELICKYDNLEEIDIVPVIEGAGDDILGIFTLVLGVLLIATGIFSPFGIGLSAGLKAGLIIGGAALLAGGISSLLASPPKFEDFREIEKKSGRQSYLFSGPQNITQEGGPVPIGYGRLIVGSQVIASSYVISDTSARTDIGDMDNEFIDKAKKAAFAGYPIKEMIWGRNETILLPAKLGESSLFVGLQKASYRVVKIITKSDSTNYKFNPKFSNDEKEDYIPEFSAKVPHSNTSIYAQRINDSASNDIYALALDSNNYIYVGGDEKTTKTAYNRNLPLNNRRYAIVAGIMPPYWQATINFSKTLDYGVDADVNSIIINSSNNKVIAFGNFSTFIDSAGLINKDYENVTVTTNKGLMLYNTGIYELDGRLDKATTFQCAAGFNIYASTFLDDGKILVGGADSGQAKLMILTATGANSGVTLPTFTDSTGVFSSIGCIYCIFKIDENNFLIGGNFERVSGTGTNETPILNDPRSGIIKLTRTATDTWRINVDFDCCIFGTTESVFNIKTIYSQQDGKIMVGGDFDRIGLISDAFTTLSEEYSGIVRLLSTGAIDTTFNCKGGFTKSKLPGIVYKILVSSSNIHIYVGGDFTHYKGDKTSTGIVRLIGG